MTTCEICKEKINDDDPKKDSLSYCKKCWKENEKLVNLMNISLEKLNVDTIFPRAEAYSEYLEKVEKGEIAVLLREEVTELLNNIDRWTHPDITKLVAKYIEEKTEMKLL